MYCALCVFYRACLFYCVCRRHLPGVTVSWPACLSAADRSNPQIHSRVWMSVGKTAEVSAQRSYAEHPAMGVHSQTQTMTLSQHTHSPPSSSPASMYSTAQHCPQVTSYHVMGHQKLPIGQYSILSERPGKTRMHSNPRFINSALGYWTIHRAGPLYSLTLSADGVSISEEGRGGSMWRG